MRLDLVVPCHNEQHRIGRTLELYRPHLADLDATLTVALDGCTDDTAEVVARHLDDDRVRMLEFPKLGKGGTLGEAFRRCDAPLIGFVDADAATPPAELRRLVDAAHSADGAIGSRRHPGAMLPGSRSRRRRIVSAGLAAVVRGAFDLPYHDTQCGAKVFRRELLERIVPKLTTHGLLFDVDLLVQARDEGFDVVEVPTIWMDQEGSRVDVVGEMGRMAASAAALWLQRRGDGTSEAPHVPTTDTRSDDAASERREEGRRRVAA